MNNYPIITKKNIKSNKEIKKIQKKNKKKYVEERGLLFRFLKKYPKASISKIIMEDGYIDMVGKKNQSKIKVIELNELLSAIKENELTGMSGNGFSTYKKLMSVIDSSAENKVLIINGAECDPGLIHDEWLIRNRLNDIIFGSKLVSEMIHASDVFLAMKLIKHESIEGINVKILPNRYPIGSEKILIKEILNVEMDKKEIPAKKGILVLNVQTIIMIAEIAKGRFFKRSRYITVADYTTGEAKVAKVNYDMRLNEVLQGAFGKQDDKVMYTGGGIMNAHQIEKDEKVTALTNFIGYGSKLSYNNDSKCKKCKKCTRNCPMGIKVHQIISDYEKNKNVNVEKCAAEKCINCGTCTFLCLAGKNTMEIVNLDHK